MPAFYDVVYLLPLKNKIDYFFDACLLNLWKQGAIDEETALQYASSPTDLKLKLEGFA